MSFRDWSATCSCWEVGLLVEMARKFSIPQGKNQTLQMCMKRTKGSFDIQGRKTDVLMQFEEGATDSTETDFLMQFREGAVSLRKPFSTCNSEKSQRTAYNCCFLPVDNMRSSMTGTALGGRSFH